MRRASLLRRLRARSARGESGFTLIETVIAITVIFGSLTALAYTATASFHYQDVARQRQSANGIADKVMEEVRGLAYDKVVAGLSSTDLAGDANIVSCSGVSRFLSCTAGTEPGSGEKIVNSPGLTTTVPLVPHRSGTAPNSDPVVNNIAFSWSTYVTQDDSVTNAPFRVTVVVTWTGGLGAGQKLVRIQSLFWSPIGCRSTSTHPFSAPCQPFFLGNATVPPGDVSVTGSVRGGTFTALDIPMMAASSAVQQEQVASAEASTQAMGGSITDTTTQTTGGVAAVARVDGDPSTGSGPYQRARCGTEVTCSGGTLTSPNGGGSNQVTLTVPTTTAGESDSAITANGTNLCPPSAITTALGTAAEVDSLPCGGAAVQQTNPTTAVIRLNGASPPLGDVNVVGIAPASTDLIWALSNRVTNPAPANAGCTPAGGTNGCIASSASRTYGSIRLGGLPANMTSPFTGNCNGYFLTMSGYSDSAKAAAGEGAPLATANLPAGNLYYWNQSTSTCTAIALNSGTLAGLNISYATTQVVASTNVTATISTVPASTTAASASTVSSPSNSSNPQPTRTDESAQVVAPTITIRYTLTTATDTIMDVTETINLGTLTVDATYAPAPSSA
jgi:type II secretory pathway pseudopilin PulG